MAKHKLNEIERENAKIFKTQHNKCKKGENRFPYEYIFIETGIGTVVDIKCPYCGVIKDISDYESW